MGINKKITNWIAYAVAAICLGIFAVFIISFIIDSYYYGFKTNTSLSYKYIVLFNENYQNKINPETSSASKLGYVYFYKFESSQICIFELEQYKMVDIKDIIVKNYFITGVNNNFNKSEINVRDNKYPYAHILLYPTHQKIDKINIHIESNIEKVTRSKNTLYIKFKETPLKFNSFEKYAEINFRCISDPPIELIILKKQDRTIFILKYNIIRDVQDKTTLLDMVKMK